MTTTYLGMAIPTVGADTDNWGNDLNADLGLIDAFAGKLMPGTEVALTSAATTDIGNAASTAVAISGTTTITSLGTVANCIRFVRFSAALTLTYNATSLILLGGGSRTVAAGAVGIYRSDASGNWRELAYFDQDISSGAAARLGSLSIAGLAPGSNTFAMNGNALIGGTLTTNGNVTLNADMTMGHGTAQGSGGGTLTCTGYGYSNQLSIGGLSSTDGNGFQVVCVSGGVMLSNGATSWASVSERAKKKNFQPIEDALGIVENIRAELGHYRHEADDAKLRPFVFYEDAKTWWPHAAQYRPGSRQTEIDPKSGETLTREMAEFKGVSYELYVPLLLAAFHQQIGINKDLAARIAALEAAPETEV